MAEPSTKQNGGLAATTDRSVLKPFKLAHIVLRTNQLAKMRQFYLDFLGSKIAFEKEGILAFLRYDDEHHRIGLFGMPHIQDKVKESSGIEVSHLFKHFLSPRIGV
jgi:catechol-2,3-dioxygenase